MITKNYKNYLIKSEGFKSVPNSYSREALFKIKEKAKVILLRFLVSGMEFDVRAKNKPEEYFLDLCLEKIEEYIDTQKELTNKVFEFRGSFIEKE